MRVVKMDKKRLKVALAVLNAVRSTFPETNEFIDSTLKEECEKERMKKILKKINLSKHFCFKFGTRVIMFLFIDVGWHGR